MRTQAATQIDGRDINFRQFVNQTEERQEFQKLLWTILLTDSTCALTKTGRWRGIQITIGPAALDTAAHQHLNEVTHLRHRIATLVYTDNP